LENRLAEIIESYDESRKLKYFLNSGKRLRPLLCLLTFSACNGSNYQKALDLASAIELHHSASLVHDDIIDRDTQRRSGPSYYKKYGIDDAILTGHRAIVLGFRCILDHDPKIVRTLFDTWDQSLKGEIEDINYKKNSIALLSKADKMYFEVIVNKTASLFAGASKLGCQEANASTQVQDVFYEYGKNIGIAYQLADDMHDIANGTELLPLAVVMSHLQGDTKQQLIELVDKEHLALSEALLTLGIDNDKFFLGEIAKAVNAAEKLIEHAPISDKKFKQMLLEAPSQMIRKGIEG
jgi:geranylgeranyl pyrophosphate synthase